MNWDKKPHIEGNAKHDSCLLRKQNYHFDHADIYGSYTTEGAFGKTFASGSTKNTANMWDQMLAENRDNKIKHYDYSKSHTLSGLLNNR
jgi:predicted oxidoreductase